MKSPLPKEAYQKNALIYKVLSNAKRLEILNILKKKETAVEELLSITALQKRIFPNTSHFFGIPDLSSPAGRGLIFITG